MSANAARWGSMIVLFPYFPGIVPPMIEQFFLNAQTLGLLQKCDKDPQQKKNTYMAFWSGLEKAD